MPENKAPSYEIVKIDSTSYRIENGGVRSFLFVGNDKSLLIEKADSCCRRSFYIGSRPLLVDWAHHSTLLAHKHLEVILKAIDTIE